MHQKIKVAIVDDDESLHDILQDLYMDSADILIKHTYTNSRKFIEDAPSLDFDVCLLDISMPDLDGLTLAQLLKNKPFIFVTGSEDKLKAALGLEPVDIVTKPFNKERLDHSLNKAIKLVNEKVEYALFCVAENKNKVSICLRDIVFADTDETDPRNKIIVMKSGAKYTLMDCKLDDLVSLSPQLIQVNRRQLIALDYINEMQYDIVSVNDAANLSIPEEITLSRVYKKEVQKRIFYK